MPEYIPVEVVRSGEPSGLERLYAERQRQRLAQPWRPNTYEQSLLDREAERVAADD